jgi:NAD-dependent DNA ligase
MDTIHASPIILKKSSSKNKTLKAAKSSTKYKTNIELLKTNGISALHSMTEKELSQIILEASKAYYNENELMTDNEFDIVKEYMENKYPKNRVLQEIGAPVEKNKVSLPYNMPSMDKIKPDTNSLQKWKQKYSGPYVLSAKLDGISALYSTENNQLKLYTRGNGTIGQDISHLIPHLLLPKVENITIRGELIMKKTTFIEKYSNTFANARNMVAGLVNQKKIDVEKMKDVDFVAYEVITPELKPSEQMSYMNKKHDEDKIITVINETVMELTNEYLSTLLVEWRENYEYTIDGVIVVDDKIYARTKKNPEHGFAFKMVLSDQVAEVKVVDVIWTPSKDGYLKPRLQVEPVTLGGAKIEYATAFNAAFVEDNKIGIGAIVKLVRSGDVIPHIMDVVVPAEKAQMPTVPYKWNATHIDIIMENMEDDETVKEKNIVGFFKGLEVDGLGPGNVKKIITAGYDSVAKIIGMSKTDFLKVAGFKEKMADKIYTSIHKQINDSSLVKIMAVSNIFGRGFGERKIEPIMNKYPDIITSLDSDDEKIKKIVEIRGIEKKTAERFVKHIPAFIDFMKTSKLQSKIEESMTAVTDTSAKAKSIVDTSHPLYDKPIVITGFRNKLLSQELKNIGAKETNAISKNTFIVIVSKEGEDTNKSESARQKNIPIMTLDTFKEKYNLLQNE